jgi:hypothetical protein
MLHRAGRSCGGSRPDPGEAERGPRRERAFLQTDGVNAPRGWGERWCVSAADRRVRTSDPPRSCTIHPPPATPRPDGDELRVHPRARHSPNGVLSVGPGRAQRVSGLPGQLARLGGSEVDGSGVGGSGGAEGSGGVGGPGGSVGPGSAGSGVSEGPTSAGPGSAGVSVCPGRVPWPVRSRMTDAARALPGLHGSGRTRLHPCGAFTPSFGTNPTPPWR